MFKNGSGPHRRLLCGICGKFQKFVGKKEADDYKNINVADGKHEVTNEELNFKLDLIISHLGL